MNGWIKIHRGLIDWEWYDDHNTTRLFIHCIIRANHAPKKWRGIQVERGQFYTSLETLSLETGLSAMQIRTCFNKLKATGEVTSSGMPRGRMVTVNNYHDYQLDNREDNRVVTGSQQGSNRVVTTNKKDKKNKNDKKLATLASAPGTSAESLPGSMDDLKARINNLRPEWNMRWNHAEERMLMDGISAQMSELEPADWAMLRKFFYAPLAGAGSWWRPNSRSKFIETFPDVYQSAMRWGSKTNNKPKVKDPFLP